MATNKIDTSLKEGKQQALSLPSISLPKGGGAIQGIGEKFTTNPVTGTGTLNVPIFTSPGRSGFGPQLTLSYDSGQGNSPFGIGWTLSLPTITRKTDKGLPKYQDSIESDVFLLSGTEDLVPAFRKDSKGNFDRDSNGFFIFDEEERDGYLIRSYRPRIEGLFARIERWTKKSNGDVHWRSLSKDNILTVYGRDDQSRISDPADKTRVFSWLICESYDDKGNAILYEYVGENDRGVDFSKVNERNRLRNANRYLKRIWYGNRKPLLLDTSKPSFRKSHLEQPDFSQANWMFEILFDYCGEDHCILLQLDEAKSEKEQHQLVQASASDTGKPWSVRPDPFSNYRSCFEVRSYRRCQRILMFHLFPELGTEPCLIRSTEFDYMDLDYSQPISTETELTHKGSTRKASFIRSVTQSGYVRIEPQTGTIINGVNYSTYIKASFPPIEFDYSPATIQEAVLNIDTESLENLPIGVDGSHYQLADLDGEGLSGILTEQAGAWFYKPNLGNGHFGPLEIANTKPSLANLSGGHQQLLDLAGDGQLDLAEFFGPVPGFYERTTDQNWRNFTPFNSMPNIPWGDSNLRFVDLTGDGHADILITEDQVFTWYPSLAEDGFDQAQKVYQPLNEEEGPHLIFSDGTETIFLSDMSGDGLVDLVRIRNGEVCYWPNIGYGRFGGKVTMDNAPQFDTPDQYNPKRIRLADIDGSGTTDIIYLGVKGVQIYLNQSGNSFSDLKLLSISPQIDNLSSVQIADLLGNGTACLVWSSPLTGDSGRQMRYIDLMGGEKPNLLICSKNNLGAEIKVHYVSSTRFYLQDKIAGNPWITRLPFPVYVVDRVETYDYISRNRFVTRYAYHHGFFDGVEREFRGFGMVEQWDTEEVDFESLKEVPDEYTNWNAASFVPPVLTRTWFHTGAFFESGLISKHFEDEYYNEGKLTDEAGEHMLLPDTILPDDLTSEEFREACRSLKGGILRTEIYGLDRRPDGGPTEESSRPYTASERNYTIRCLQPKGGNKHAVFCVYPRETIDFNYERQLYDVVTAGKTKKYADPRITHNMTLEIDDYGNILKSLSICYGRRHPDTHLSVEDQITQTNNLITYGDNRYTNAVSENDAYRTPLQSQASTYELINIERYPGLTSVYPLLFDEVRELIGTKDFAQGNWDIPYHDVKHVQATGNHPYRRLVENTRTLYRSNKLDCLLPLGSVDSLALPGESYRLAFTPGLLSTVFQRKDNGQAAENLLPIPAVVLGNKSPDGGGYVDLDGNGHWWIPSGRIYYAQNYTENPINELSFASQHFFLPHRFDDAFDQRTIVTYDDHDLLLLESVDPLSNRVTAGTRDGSIINKNDYRVLKPALIIDSNGAVSEAIFDALGLVIATAIHKGPTGDSLQNIQAYLTQKEIDNFFVDPRGQTPAVLGLATTYMIYDMCRYYRLNDPSKPPYTATLVRETHVNDPFSSGMVKLQVGFSYSNGLGLEVQKKIQAESGPIDDTYTNPRWVGSGWTIFNNKGKPIRKFERFFDNTHDFRYGKEVGVSTIVFYDPVERLVTTLHPNNTYEKVVFDPWHQKTYDLNDNATSDPRSDEDIECYVTRYFSSQPETWQTWYKQRIYGDIGIEEQKTAEKTGAHADTPNIAYFDTLGRTFLMVANNGKDTNGEVVSYETHVLLDIEDNQREITDAKGRIVMQYDYDMVGNRIKQTSMEAGTRWVLNDVTGKPIRTWDNNPSSRRMTYDALRRPLELFITINNGTEFLAEKTEYGESKPNPETTNHRLKPWKIYDGAGVLENVNYDFKGNLMVSKRNLLQDYKTPADWSNNPKLETETFTSRTLYDALNRPTQITVPHSNRPGTRLNVIQPIYNEANLLERIETWLELNAEPNKLLDPNTATIHIVKNIDYNAKGQRLLIEYGNSASTSFQYDPLTFLLKRMQTLRNRDKLIALSYFYDPTGNITAVNDDAQETIYFNGQVVRPKAEFTYDAIYRLIKASGREHIGQVSEPETTWNDRFRISLAHPNDGQKMRNYCESYEYDEVGNIVQFDHKGDNGNWIRDYEYEEESLIEPGTKNNQLTRTVVHPNSQHPILEEYAYDAHGNMKKMPHLQQMNWDFEDRLHCVDKGTEKIFYAYDANGQRLRKVSEKNNGTLIEERIYLGRFEIFRRHINGSLKLERETLHVVADDERVALIETRTIDTDSIDQTPRQVVRYQYSNNLGSAILELDANANVISYEEYYPYGGTSYQAVEKAVEVPLKRYRYAGDERDEETGLYCQSQRYYAPWLGRWTSCDPVGLVDGTNLYIYTRDNPIVFKDTGGTQTSPYSYASQQNYLLSVDANGITIGSPYPPTATANPLQLRVEWPGSSPQMSGYIIGPMEAGGTMSGVTEVETPSSETERKPKERTFWNRGGGTLVAGGVALGVGILILASGPVGWFAGLVAGLAIAGGSVGVGVGGIQLGLSYSGMTTAEQDQEISEAAGDTMALCSPGGLVGGVVGVGLTGDREGLRKGALVGGIAEAGGSIAYGLGNMAYREYQFSKLYGGSSYSWQSVRSPIQEAYGLENVADRMRPNSLFYRNIERMELSHFIPQRSTIGYEAIFNRPWSIKPLWGTEHALVDPFRLQFMTPAFKAAYTGQQLQGIQRFLQLAPEWMHYTGYGAGSLLNQKLRLELLER